MRKYFFFKRNSIVSDLIQIVKINIFYALMNFLISNSSQFNNVKLKIKKT